MSLPAPWYETWFDSPWYHILYCHRDEGEAAQFMDRITAKLGLEPGAGVLDLACGRGRHAKYLSARGYRVTGIDLSESSISYAKSWGGRHTEFYVHDMRNLFRVNYYHCILNLFTSFGYFESDRDNRRVVAAAAAGLRPAGTFVVDYCNAVRTVSDLVPSETVEAGGIRFYIDRAVEGDWLVKRIRFHDKGKDMEFGERVRLLKAADFEGYFTACGLKMASVFGDYNLGAYDGERSERMIIFGQKLK